MSQKIQFVLLILVLLFTAPVYATKCLFVSSYHRGYDWSDRVEQGLRSVLSEQCELKQFNMDTKRYKSEQEKITKGQEAKNLIDAWQPNIVITADDNAAKYLIQPYYKNSDLPFVFCGVNWTAEEYGFPYRNVTGMIEVAPIVPMLRKAMTIANHGSKAFYIGADTLTEGKNLARFAAATTELGLELDSRLVKTSNDWLDAYREAQSYDFIILGSNSGINDWDDEYVKKSLLPLSKRLSVTNHGWMMPFAMFGMTKVPEEQGEWSAKTALAILRGMSPTEIPIVANRKWDLWSNEALLSEAAIEIPRSIKYKAKRIRQ